MRGLNNACAGCEREQRAWMAGVKVACELEALGHGADDGWKCSSSAAAECDKMLWESNGELTEIGAV